MKLRSLKFVWGASDAIAGRWYGGVFGVYDRDPGSRVMGHAVSVRGLLRWTAGLAVAGYLAGATALYWFWQHNPYNVLTYPDALLRPFRGEAIHDKQGQAFIAQGTDAMRESHWWEAVALLRLGLTYHPNDPRARLVLAQFYVAANQRPVALKILQEGLKPEFPGRAYLQVLFDAAEAGEDYGLVVNTCARYLPLWPRGTAARDRRWLLERQFAALQAARQFSAVLVLAEAEGPGDLTEENRVLALLGLGRSEEALALLADWRKRPDADLQQVLRLTVRTLRELRRFDEMAQTLEALRQTSPAEPRLLVYGVVQWVLSDRDAAAEAALDNYIFRFGGAALNFQLVAEPLAEIGSSALLERCIAAAAQRGYALQPLRALLVQAEVQRGEWAAARRTLAAMTGPMGPDAAAGKFWRDWMQQLVDAAAPSGEAGPAGLPEFLRSRPWSITVFRRSIAALRRAGRLELARDTIALALREFPASEWLQAQQDEVGRAPAGQALVAAPPGAAVEKLPGEKLFFQRMDGCLSDGRWAEAEQMMSEARNTRPAPGWIVARDSDLRLAQIRIFQAKGERAAMISAAKLYLNGDTGRVLKVLEIARASFAQGDRPGAVALAGEVLRAAPDTVAAQRLLKEWQPPATGRK